MLNTTLNAHMLKILILLLAYNRPNLILQSLESIQKSTYKNWHCAVVDDGSTLPAEEIIRGKFTPEELEKTTFYRINDTKADKVARGGSIIGEKMNQAMEELGCDLAIFLCDDDLLIPDYLENLNKYFTSNPEVMYAYSHVRTFKEGEDPWTKEKEFCWLNHEGPIDPFCRADASQVCWRVPSALEGGIKFPSPKTANLDADFYGPFCEKYGLCHPTGFDSQMKRVHKNQLGITQGYDAVD